MRNTLFAAALVCMAVCPLVAQTQDATQTDPRRWRFGMQVGGGLASMYKSGPNYATFIGPRSAFTVHAYAERDVVGRFGIAYETGVSIKGAFLGFGEAGTIFYAEDQVSLAYLQGAVLPNFNIGKRQTIALGAEYGLKVSETSRFILDGQKHELGVVAQIMYVLNTNLTFGFRANASLTPYLSTDFTDENGQTLGSSNLNNLGGLFIARFRLR